MMRPWRAVWVVASLGAGGCDASTATRTDAPPTSISVAAVAAPLPADVVAFRRGRDECDHLRGEEPTDAARAAFLKEEAERACTGTDAALRALRARHADRPAVIAALASYEDDVE